MLLHFTLYKSFPSTTESSLHQVEIWHVNISARFKVISIWQKLGYYGKYGIDWASQVALVIGKETTYKYRRCKRCGFSPWVGRTSRGGHAYPPSILG